MSKKILEPTMACKVCLQVCSLDAEEKDISVMRKQTFPAKIYWEEIIEDRSEVKDELIYGKFQEPGHILNSTEVTAEAKPWLLKRITKKQNGTRGKVEQCLNYVEQVNHKEKICNGGTLKELRYEDKQKVANLIRELAKSGDEKDKALRELNVLKESYGVKLIQLKSEKDEAIKKHDVLKERLLEYEILIEKINLEQNGFTETKKSDLDSDISASVVDNFSELFLEHQQKFYKQQEVLQDQIEHLQRLQESILKQQGTDFKELDKQLSIDENVYKNKNIIPNKHVMETPGSNTKRLESYIQSETSMCHNQKDNIQPDTEGTKKTMNTGKCGTNSGIIVSNSILSDNSDKTTQILHNNTSDMCIQTEDQTPITRNSECEINSIKLQESLKISSRTSGTPSDHLDSIKNSFRRNDSNPNNGVKISQGSCSGSKRIQTLTTFPDDETSSNDNVQYFPNPSASAVKRKHFQPSSILDIVDGMLPRSTSTSVDQYTRTTEKYQIINKKTEKIGKNDTNKTLKKSTKYFDEEDEERNLLEDVFFLK